MCGVRVESEWQRTMTFVKLLERLHQDKHTGPVVLQFTQGTVTVAEIPTQPMRIALDKGGK